MHVYQLNGFGEAQSDLSQAELNKLIQIGDTIESIANGTTPATAAQRASAQKIIATFQSQEAGFSGFGDFGENFFKKITHPVVVMGSRLNKVVVSPITGYRQGGIGGAAKATLNLANPVSVAASVVTDNQRIIDYAKLTSPLSVAAIENKDLRKKAAIGYAAAAAIATGAFFVTGAAAAAAGTEVAATGMTAAEMAAAGASASDVLAAGATFSQVASAYGTMAAIGAEVGGAFLSIGSALGIGKSAVNTAMSATKLAQAAGVKLPGQRSKGESSGSAAGGEQPPEEQPGFLSQVATPQNILLGIGILALGTAGVMLVRKRSKKG